MTNKTKLEIAIENQASSLDPAQREFVLKEFDTYLWNARKISKIEAKLDGKEGDYSLEQEAKLFKQRHQLVAEQSALFSHIMRWLQGTSAGKSALEEFLDC